MFLQWLCFLQCNSSAVNAIKMCMKWSMSGRVGVTKVSRWPGRVGADYGKPSPTILTRQKAARHITSRRGIWLVYFAWYQFFFPARIFNLMSINQKQQINQLQIAISVQLALHGHFFRHHHQETLDGKKIHCKELVNKGWWCWVSIAVHPLVNYIISQTMSSYGDHHDYDYEEEIIWLWSIWYQNTNSLFQWSKMVLMMFEPERGSGNIGAAKRL